MFKARTVLRMMKRSILSPPYQCYTNTVFNAAYRIGKRQLCSKNRLPVTTANDSDELETLDFLPTKDHCEDEDSPKNFIWISAPELIRKEGFPLEEHEVITEDGYILSLFRIPGKDPTSRPVLINHGLFNSCRDWLVPRSRDPLPFQLHDAGFDVWLANNRGTTYTKHQKHSREDPQFWDYRNEDIAKKDHPSVFNYILELTRKRFFCVAYSWSGYTLMEMLTTEPKYNSDLLGFVGVAPYVTTCDMTSPVRYFAQSEMKKALKWALANLKLTSPGCFVHPRTRPLMQQIFLDISSQPLKLKLFEKYMGSMVGVSPKGTSMTAFGDSLYDFPNDASIDCVMGLLDNVITPRFCSSYLEGCAPTEGGNVHLPPYDLSKATVPKLFYFMEFDTLVSLKDGRKLMKMVGPDNTKGYVVKGFNHVDALYGRYVGQLNAKIVQHLLHFPYTT